MNFRIRKAGSDFFKSFECVFLVLFVSCSIPKTDNVIRPHPVKLITADPGHFHAALVQKHMYDGVDSTIHVYAPGGPDVRLHLKRVDAFNNRIDNPTRWNSVVYTGSDFFEKMLSEKAGNVVVLSGRNAQKAKYIQASVEAGFHVLADKPMAIDAADFDRLRDAFKVAASNGRMIYDMMTERYEITTILQREFSLMPAVFGTLEKGTPDDPAVVKESVHHFYKTVSGEVLVRPPWYFDVKQQGEGIVDVTTHLVDLIQWECFPDQAINYEQDIQVDNARRWVTGLTLNQFKTLTKSDTFPEYLVHDVVNDTIINIYCNGEINYRIKGVCARVSVVWAYKPPEGAGDTHYSVIRGTKANLVIRQGFGQQFKPVLYIEPLVVDETYGKTLMDKVQVIQEKYPGVELSRTENGWQVIIPDHYRVGHEEHFAQVTDKFLSYVKNGDMPSWEVPNMLARYYTTTRALQMAKSE